MREEVGDGDGGCWVTMLAASDLDSDATIDLWSISTKPRNIDGETIAAGAPFHHVNDVER